MEGNHVLNAYLYVCVPSSVLKCDKLVYSKHVTYQPNEEFSTLFTKRL
jgi:hypothetical protein